MARLEEGSVVGNLFDGNSVDGGCIATATAPSLRPHRNRTTTATDPATATARRQYDSEKISKCSAVLSLCRISRPTIAVSLVGHRLEVNTDR
ncbi:MAG: hypothetical protein ABEI99_03895, partial [Halobaculum sp.]